MGVCLCEITNYNTRVNPGVALGESAAKELFMVANLYVIKDDTTNVCTPVFQQANNSAAIRHFGGYLRAMPVYMRPDFSLWIVGTIEDVRITADSPVMVMRGQAVPFGDEVPVNG